MRKIFALLICGVLAAGPSPGFSQTSTGTVSTASTLSTDPEVFRAQLLDLLGDLDAALTGLAAYPEMQSRLAPYRERTGIQIPFTQDVYDVFINASDDELMAVRESLIRAPGLMNSPAILEEAMAQMPAPATSGVTASFSLSSCSDNYTETQKKASKRRVVRALDLIADQIHIVHIVIETAADVAGQSTADTPFIGKVPSIPFIIVAGVLDAVVLGLRFAIDELGIGMNESDLCLASCLTDIAPQYAGRGCDNRDNNCAGGIDELIEDEFPPSISVDASPLGVCFPDEPSAKNAFELALNVEDDCQEVTPSINYTSVPSLCQLTGQATVSDGRNSAGPVEVSMRVDGMSPQILPATMAGCYPTLGDARNALAASQIIDCPGTNVSTTVMSTSTRQRRSLERQASALASTGVNSGVIGDAKECVADLELRAVDECGNQSTFRTTVRVDNAPPVVDIDELLIAEPGELACFTSQSEAVHAVREATRYGDNCTPVSNLNFSTTPSGTSCNLLVTSMVTAMDACGGSASDSYLTRVDTEVPVVSCTVATDVLWPPDARMVDVGLTINAYDNCDGGSPMVGIEVTSDEPTGLAYTTLGTIDPYPDALVLRDANGAITGLQLRAQRSSEGSADGRVYRIRVSAMDSCHLKSYSDCFVTVPSSNPDPSTAQNSGQNFDATIPN